MANLNTLNSNIERVQAIDNTLANAPGAGGTGSIGTIKADLAANTESYASPVSVSPYKLTILSLMRDVLRVEGSAWYWQQRFLEANNHRLELIKQLEAGE